MKLKDIWKDGETKIFVVTDQDTEDEADWEIVPTDFELIPDEEGTYIVKAAQVTGDDVKECYMDMIMPERIAELVIKVDGEQDALVESIHEQESSVIPAVGSECFGNYELYCAKEDAEVGIHILRAALPIAENKNVVAEDLGYILRDQHRYDEAIEAFLISEEHGPSSEYIYKELSELYGNIGMVDKEEEYLGKYHGRNS